jgi:cephalosporin hydroxylase
MKLRTRLGRLYRNACAPVHFRLSRAELCRLLTDQPSSSDPPNLWRITRGYRGFGWFADISAWQVESEYCDLVSWVSQQNPHVILEIGTAKGATLLAWSRIASELVISVDLPGGIHGGGYPAIKERLFREFTVGRPGVEMLIYRGDSHNLALRDQIKAAIGGRTIDFLFIDGDHTYRGVSHDFELWAPLVMPGGHVAFHDILPHRELKDCEVDRFWQEIKGGYQHFEIVADPQQGWGGIGVVKMSGIQI